MFWVALALRLLFLTVAHTYRFRPILDHFQFGWEMGRTARALATGYGYADPFAGHTGPRRNARDGLLQAGRRAGVRSPDAAGQEG